MKFKIITILIFLIILMGVFGATPEINQFSYEPTPAVPGNIITVYVQVKNLDNSVKEDVTIELKNEYPFTIEEEKSKNIGSILGLAKGLAQFKVYVDPSAENGDYSLPVKISTKQESTGKITNKTISISGKAPIVKVINISNYKLIPGQEKEITFELQNIGTSNAYDILIELQEDRTIATTGTIIEREITPLGSALAYMEKLEPKRKKTGKIKISVNREADLKNYTLPVIVSYRDSSGERTEKTSYIGFKIAGNVNLDLTLKEEVLLVAGQEKEITIELFNKGAGKAEFTIVNLEADFGKFEKEKQFIGSLEPNDVDSFKTNLKINSNIKTQETTIKANIEYQDIDATTKTIQLEIPVKVYSREDGAINLGINPFSGIINLIIIIVVLIVAWQGYKKFKKKN